MPRFTIRRILQMISTILAVALLIFVIFSVIPGSFASSLMSDGRGGADAEMLVRINAEFGLDKPVHLRFFEYVVGLFQLDLGTSFRFRQPVTEVIGDRIWASQQLSIAAMVFAVSGLSMPQFWLGLLPSFGYGGGGSALSDPACDHAGVDAACAAGADHAGRGARDHE